MARIARFVAPGFPHHVTQRGNRRVTVFFSDARPLGSDAFLDRLAALVGRDPRPRKRGPTRKVSGVK